MNITTLKQTFPYKYMCELYDVPTFEEDLNNSIASGVLIDDIKKYQEIITDIAYFAIRDNHLNLLKFLYEHFKIVLWFNPISECFYQNSNIEIVKYFLDNQHNYNYKFPSTELGLEGISRHKNLDMVKFLLENNYLHSSFDLQILLKQAKIFEATNIQDYLEKRGIY